ncbi:MAG: hypothetical protein WD598_15165 [Acidimicrobiia bacterium]
MLKGVSMSEVESQNASRVETLLLGLMALVAADRDERLGDGDARRPEAILAGTGLSLREVAMITGKKYETVKTIVRRSKVPATARRKRERSAAEPEVA